MIQVAGARAWDSPRFIGIILLPIIGNAAEHYTAIKAPAGLILLKPKESRGLLQRQCQTWNNGNRWPCRTRWTFLWELLRGLRAKWHFLCWPRPCFVREPSENKRVGFQERVLMCSVYLGSFSIPLRDARTPSPHAPSHTFPVKGTLFRGFTWVGGMLGFAYLGISCFMLQVTPFTVLVGWCYGRQPNNMPSGARSGLLSLLGLKGRPQPRCANSQRAGST